MSKNRSALGGEWPDGAVRPGGVRGENVGVFRGCTPAPKKTELPAECGTQGNLSFAGVMPKNFILRDTSTSGIARPSVCW